MEIILLKYTKYQKGIEENLFYVKEIGKPFKTQKDILNIAGVTKIISFNFETLIPHLEIEKNTHYFDLEKVNKQLIGRSKWEFTKNNLPWNIWNAISLLDHQEFNISKDDFDKRILDVKDFYQGSNTKDLDIGSQISFLLDFLEKLYIQINEKLTNSNENYRYLNIEKRLNNILFETSKKGISFDSEKVKKHIEEIEVELYKFRNKLQLEYGIFSKYDYENLSSNLINIVPENLKLNTKDFWKYLKSKRKEHELFDVLLIERKLAKNKTILTRIGSLNHNTIYPYFDYFGTITSRILVTAPSLQQLNKKYRDIIIPDAGKSLLYFDYSQFEAGLLASQADDVNLTELYDSDIYNGIVLSIGEDKITRDEAKQFFYSYCYGGERENLNNDFFNQFPNLVVYENLVWKEFENNGYIDTEIGNRRYKTIGVENIKEEKWLLSQKIQGLASLILKKVILEVSEKIPNVDFLLPMHDAVLYQVSIEELEQSKTKIEEIFKSAMKEYCAKLNPKVTVKDFNE
ncbi:DNA polymerase [Chryseobacterium timonianum]|uniref:DNA polymerase n=1 Tax=Chryseobacterium timonianum TaxID=1805473 RepID=UPI001F4A956A|nr:DNA polymerase [Chryseobacterium timonianum]